MGQLRGCPLFRWSSERHRWWAEAREMAVRAGRHFRGGYLKMTDLFELSDQEFDELVLQAEKPVLVDFWAPWCGPCRRLSPILEEVAEALAENVQVMKLNTDENPKSPGRFGVMSIPTLILFSGGNEVGRFVGVMPKAQLQRRLEEALGLGGST